MRKPRPGTVFLLLWGLFLAGSVAVYLTYLQPSRLGKTVSDSLNSAFGVRCDIQQVSFSLFPQPAVTVAGLRLNQGASEHLTFRVDSCRAELSWMSIILFKPLVRSVNLANPVLDLILPLTPGGSKASEPTQKPENIKSAEGATPFGSIQTNGPTGTPPFPPLPPMFDGLSIKVENGAARIQTKDDSQKFDLNGINGKIRLPGLFHGEADLSITTGVFRFAPAPAVTVSQFSLKIEALNMDPSGDVTGTVALSAGLQIESPAKALGHPIKPAYDYFPLPHPAKLALALDVKARPAERSFTLSGKADAAMTLPMNGHDTPIAIMMPFVMTRPDALRVDGMTVNMDGDMAVLRGDMTGLTRHAPVFTGQADIQHFSLTRWFGFGRKMSAGLQNALNDISGVMDFVLSPQGITASRIEAGVRGLKLVGQGSCPNFREPDVLISGQVSAANQDDVANLNPLFPEINGQPAEKPVLPPPAVPLEDDGIPGKVGYDIHLAVDKADIWKLSVGGVDCHIVPAHTPERTGVSAIARPEYALLKNKTLGPMPDKGALLLITVADAYGGKGEGFVHLDTKNRILASIQNASTEAPSVRLAGYPALGGRLKAEADITFSGPSAGRIVSTLAGTANASVTQGFLGSKEDKRQAFRTLNLQLQAKAQPPQKGIGDDLPASMDYSGQWKIALDTKDWTLSTNGPATLTFSMTNGLPLRMTPQPASFRVRLDKNGPGLALWPDDLILDVKGQTGFDMETGTASLSDISGGRPGIALGGSLRVNQMFKNPVVEGRISARTATLREVSRLFGLTLPATVNPTMFSTFSFAGDMKLDDNALDFKNIRSRLDKTNITGSLNVKLGKRPFWTADTSFDSLNLDAYWPAPSTGPSTPIQTEFLLQHDLDAQVSGQLMTVASTPIANVRLPISLRQGILSSNALTGSFPGGGSLRGTLYSETKPGGKDARGRALDNGQVDARLKMNLTEVNMMPLTKSRGQETLMAGTGSGRMELQATLRTWGDIPSRLDGNWSMAVRDGYLISAKAAAAAQQTATPTVNFGMSGTGEQQPTPSRTPFNNITATGSILAGVVHSNNFSLKGTMLSITGSGSINLNNQTINAKATATLLGVPEMPVEISGSLSNPKTDYKLMGAVAGTIGNLGGTVLDIVGGVLTAPFRLFMGKKEGTKP